MATKNIVPNADSEGGIGTSSKYWATGFIDAITTTGNLVIGGSIDLEGAIDVNGTTNLNIVDIDGAVNIGAEVTLAAANKIIFNDASQFIHASSNAILNLGATDEIDLTATAIDVNGTMDVSGAFTNGSTLVSTGKITADAGIDIDNINIDGTTIALSSGNLTLDVEGEIILDSNGTGTIRFNDDGTNFGMVFGDSSNFTLISKVQDKDMIFQGNDGGSTITALTLDMSEAGVATFNDDLIIKTGGTIGGASDPDLLTLSANTLTLTHANSGIFFQSVGPVNSDNSTNNFRMALYHNGANNLIPTAKTGFTAAGNAVFLGDTGVDIIIGTGNSSGAPSNSFIGLEHSGNVTMNAGASTPDIPAFKLDDADDITLTRGRLNNRYTG